MKIRTLIALALVVFITAGCSQESKNTAVTPTPSPPGEITPAATPAQHPPGEIIQTAPPAAPPSAPVTQAPPPGMRSLPPMTPAPDLPFSSVSYQERQTVKEGANAFGMNLFRELVADNQKNIFFSPASIYTCLAMAYAGAAGSSAQQMAATMRINLPTETFHPALGSLIYNMQQQGSRGKYYLNIANRSWKQLGMPFLPSFLGLIRDDYGADAIDADFNDPKKVAGEINKWINENTMGLITEGVPPGLLKRDTLLVLVNTIYFKGKWKVPFPKQNTIDKPFTLLGSNNIKVEMMRKESPHGVYGHQGEGFKFASLPYEGGVSMLLLVPDRPDGIIKFSSITNQWLQSNLRLDAPVSELWLPRFEMEYSRNLKDLLKKMGMVDVFTIGKADLSGMTGQPWLWLDEVAHGAVVKVDEEGTVAAAATVATAAGSTPAEAPPKPIIVHADRPFLFFIMDPNGLILFAGRVMDPRKEE